MGGLNLSGQAFEGECGALVLSFPQLCSMVVDLSSPDLQHACTVMCLFTATRQPMRHQPVMCQELPKCEPMTPSSEADCLQFFLS